MGKANQLRIAQRNLAAQGISSGAQQAELARLRGLSSGEIRAGNLAARPMQPQTATVNALPKPPGDLEQFPHVGGPPVISDPMPPWMQMKPLTPPSQGPSPMAGALLGGFGGMGPMSPPQFTPQPPAQGLAPAGSAPLSPMGQQQAQAFQQQFNSNPMAPGGSAFGGAPKPPMSAMQRPMPKPPGSPV